MKGGDPSVTSPHPTPDPLQTINKLDLVTYKLYSHADGLRSFPTRTSENTQINIQLYRKRGKERVSSSPGANTRSRKTLLTKQQNPLTKQ